MSQARRRSIIIELDARAPVGLVGAAIMSRATGARVAEPSPEPVTGAIRPAAPRVGIVAAPVQRLDVARILEYAQETCFTWDLTTDVLRFDRHAAALFGVRHPGELEQGLAFQLKIKATDAHRRRVLIAAASASGAHAPQPAGHPYRIEYGFHPLGRGQPHVIYIEEAGRWWAGPDGAPTSAVGVMRVITERHEAEQRLRFQAEHDQLTGQLNRSALMNALAAAIQRSSAARTPFAFLMASVNGLDVINETFGFEAGDQMLSGVAAVIKSRLRAGDSIGRFASNKLGIVVHDCGPGAMPIVSERVMAAVRTTPIQTPASRLAATISIGGVCLPEAMSSTGQVVAASLQALDQARRRRTDSFVAYEHRPEAERARRRNTDIANAVIKALDEQRMMIDLQPMISVKTGRPEHYECLLRMINPDGTRVSAGEFMPIAEQLGLSQLIDLRSQELVIDLLKVYPEAKLSLNVSGLTTGDDEWLLALHRLTGGNRKITERLTIEITETAAIHDLDQTMVFVDTIKDLGCKAAIDDFGVGYTNFRNLKLLRADLVKIDGIFVKNVCHDTGDQVFIKSMVELAKAFGMETVAEWVGDAETAAYLAAAGIDYLQGYHYSAPVKPELLLGSPVQTGQAMAPLKA